MTARRSPGTGALETRRDKAGRETYYGRFYAGDRQVRRRLGRKRTPGTREGFTKAQAEKALREVIAAAGNGESIPIRSAHTIKTAGDAYLRHLDNVMGRKPSTCEDYRMMIDRHLAPHFGGRDLAKIDADEIGRYRTAKLRDLAPKTVQNQLMFLHGIFAFAAGNRRRWITSNPVADLERAPTIKRDRDIRYLSIEELDAALRVLPADGWQAVDGALFLTAALTGLRMGELVALRWRDVDWIAGVVRVRQNYTRGRFGTPKSNLSSRAVPMADRVAGELDRLFKASEFQDDDALVFGTPGLGSAQATRDLRRRFKQALKLAKVREVRFHDLRHTFGTQMASAGAPLIAIKEWMGHADIQTTMIYAAWAADPFAGAGLVAKAFGGLSQGHTEGHKPPPNQTNSDQHEPDRQAENLPLPTP